MVTDRSEARPRASDQRWLRPRVPPSNGVGGTGRDGTRVAAGDGDRLVRRQGVVAGRGSLVVGGPVGIRGGGVRAGTTGRCRRPACSAITTRPFPLFGTRRERRRPASRAGRDLDRGTTRGRHLLGRGLARSNPGRHRNPAESTAGPTEGSLDAAWFSQVPTIEQWSELAERAARTAAPWASALVKRLPDFTDLNALVGPPQPDRLTVAHTDLQPKNVVTTATGFALLVWRRRGRIA